MTDHVTAHRDQTERCDYEEHYADLSCGLEREAAEILAGSLPQYFPH
jgi:hypothetical protein